MVSRASPKRCPSQPCPVPAQELQHCGLDRDTFVAEGETLMCVRDQDRAGVCEASVDALPPRAAGRMCWIGDRARTEAPQVPCKRAAAVAARGSSPWHRACCGQIRPSIGIQSAVCSGAIDRTDTTYGAHADLRVGVHRVVIARQETRKYRGTHGTCRRWQTTTGPDNHESRNEGTHSC